MQGSEPPQEPEAVVAHGELVERPASGAEPAAGEAEERTESVEEPAKVMRIGSMIKQLLEEVRGAELDERGAWPPEGDLRHVDRRARLGPVAGPARRAAPGRHPVRRRRGAHRRRAADRPGPARRLARGAVPRHPGHPVRPADGGPRPARGHATPAPARRGRPRRQRPGPGRRRRRAARHLPLTGARAAAGEPTLAAVVVVVGVLAACSGPAAAPTGRRRRARPRRRRRPRPPGRRRPPWWTRPATVRCGHRRVRSCRTARSPRHRASSPGVANPGCWVHNDSGGPPRLYASPLTAGRASRGHGRRRARLGGPRPVVR